MKEYIEEKGIYIILGVLVVVLFVIGMVLVVSNQTKTTINTEEGHLDKVVYSQQIEHKEDFNYAQVENDLENVEDGVYVVGDYVKGLSELGLPVYYYTSQEERYDKTFIEKEEKAVIKRGENIKVTNDVTVEGIKEIWR